MAMSGYCDSWASTNGDSTGKGAYYRWSWTATHTSPGLTTIDWTLQGRGRTSTPTWLLNECYITVDTPGPGQIVAMEWGVNQDTGDGTNTSFNHNKSKSWRTPGSFTITHTDAAAITLTVTMKVAFYNGEGTGRTTTSTITVDANPPQYAIAYDANSGSGAPAAQTKIHGTNLTLSSTRPTKASASSTSTGTITLTYASNGGSSTPANGTGTYTNTTTTTYTFSKWNTAANGSGTNYNAGGTYSANAAATLYAQYTSSSSTSRTSNPTIKTAAAISRADGSVTGYKVTFNSNGSSATAPAAITSTKTRKYTFTKWKSGSGTNLNANTSYTFSVNSTLTAQWSTSDTNNAITLPAAISRTGYTFGGWNTKADGTGTTYLAGTSYTPSAATTLYAKWTKITYTLTLQKGTGVKSFTGAGTYDYNSKAPTVATASTGYHLTKYTGTLHDGSGDGEWAVSGTTDNNEWTMLANRTIKVWAALDTYAITYDANGGSGSMANGIKTYGKDFTLPANGFTKPSNTSVNHTITLNGNGGTSPAAKTCTRTTVYSFSKWALNSASGVEYAVGAKYTANQAATFYAKWSGSTSGTVALGSTTRADGSVAGYRITYNGNGGTSSVAYQSVTNKIKYTFTGWNTKANGAGTAYDTTTSYSFDADTTLYAQWKSTTTKGSTYLPEAGECTKAGYTCIGWATTSTATTPAYAPGAHFTPTSNTTLYAVWKPHTYTISYDANGGSGAPAAQTKTHDVNLTLSSTIPIKAGYKFLGWGTKATDTMAWYPAGGTYTANVSATLYAVWRVDTTTLTINPNGGLINGSSDTISITQNYGSEYTVPTPVLVGSTFSGWVHTGGGSFTNDIFTFGTADGALTANWGNNSYTVAFNGNGGSGSMSAMECIFGVSYNLNENTFVRTGYKFLGWSTSKNATTATYDDKQVISNLATSGTVTLYAVWQGFTYYITYDSNNGSEEQTSSTHQVGTYSPLLNNTFTYSNYSFLGWSTSPSGSVEYSNMAPAPAGLVTTDKQTITLYAIWSEASPWILSQVKIYAPRSATDSTLIWWVV